MGFEENEISIKANGGTELTKRLLASKLPADLLENFQIVSSRVRDLDESKIRVFFAHDLPNDPESTKFADKDERDKFHKFVYVSDWQYSMYQTVLGIPYATDSAVIENCIVPFPEHDKPKEGPVRLVYMSTPHRGLDVLVAAFKEIEKVVPDIHLDVFSSFNLYGWENGDAQFEPLFEECRNHPKITYHGAVDQETLRAHLLKTHILAYPCTWPETSCRVLMECMSAKVLPVHPNFAALPYTSAGFSYMYQGDTDRTKHAGQFYAALLNAIKAIQHPDGIMDSHLQFSKIYADNRFDVANIVPRWEAMLRGLLQEYPTIESRKFPTPSSQLFSYNTLQRK